MKVDDLKLLRSLKALPLLDEVGEEHGEVAVSRFQFEEILDFQSLKEKRKQNAEKTFSVKIYFFI